MGKTLVVGGKSTEAYRCEHVNDALEGIHSRQPITDKTRKRERDVDTPQPLGRIGDTRCQPRLFHGAGKFRTKDLRAAYAEHWQNGNGEHQNTHTANPTH